MAEEALQFQGTFQMWWYSPSKQQLLLRSQKTTERPTQIDILFAGVASLELPIYMQDISVQKVDAATLPHPPIWPGEPKDLRDTYRVTGRGFEGYVAADYVKVDESDREYFDRSPLVFVGLTQC